MEDAGRPQPDSGPLPLSFPAILRNPKLADRFARLEDAQTQTHQRWERPEPEGKRWARRRENARFTHNPHVALPTVLDLAHPLQLPSSTFPHPLPSCLPRTLLLPPSRPPPSVPQTSTAGLFSLSLRGARRNLRARPSSAYVVKATETHLVAWLQGGTYLDPDQAKGVLSFPGDPVGGREDIREVAREPGRLVWAVKPDSPIVDSGHHDGGFERYVVHCVARWYGVVSFSKETDGRRLTYLLRPNFARPDPRVDAISGMLNTPPATDASDFHVSDASFSDFNPTDASDYSVSDVDSATGDPTSGIRSLSDIEESRPSSPASWSVVGGPDFAINSDDDADERGFAASMESLSLSAHVESDDSAALAADTTRLRDATVTRVAPIAADEVAEPDEDTTPSRAERDRLRTLYPRSPSSPSPARRSPHRLPTARKSAARRKRKVKDHTKEFAGAMGMDKGTFYDYLFA